MRNTQLRDIEVYETLNGQVPFTEWFASIQDTKTQTRIRGRLDRLEKGNFGETAMRKYRKWREIVIEQLAADWDAAFDYIQFAMEEYQVDGDTAVFLLALRTFVESQGGITELSKKTGVNREIFSKVLSSEEPPRLDMFVTILSALGGKLSIKPLGSEDFRGEKEDVDAVLATSEGIKPDIVFARDNK